MSSINGFDSVTKRLLELQKEFIQEVKSIVEINVGDMEMQATRDAPGPGDMIRTQKGAINQNQISPNRRGQTSISQGIGYKLTNNGLTGTVFVERSVGDIAAYVEFGTGQDAASYLATVEPEYREQARAFYVNGKGTIIGKPYLYPAYLKYRQQFVNDLKELVAKTKF